MPVLLFFPYVWEGGPSSPDRRSGDSDEDGDEWGNIARDGPSSPRGGGDNDDDDDDDDDDNDNDDDDDDDNKLQV